MTKRSNRKAIAGKTILIKTISRYDNESPPRSIIEQSISIKGLVGP